jgi:hypothetical protein
VNFRRRLADPALRWAGLLTLCPSLLAAQAGDSLPSWIRVGPEPATVHLDLEAARGDSGMSLNGQRRGDLQIVVPKGWTVRWSWRNADSLENHSLVVVTEREKLPNEAGQPAFTNARTRSPSAGLRLGQKDETTFVAEDAGWYWLLCGVPGHALNGEWIGLRVDPAANRVAAIRKNR